MHNGLANSRADGFPRAPKSASARFHGTLRHYQLVVNSGSARGNVQRIAVFSCEAQHTSVIRDDIDIWIGEWLSEW
jgi:hypothetical protein